MIKFTNVKVSNCCNAEVTFKMIWNKGYWVCDKCNKICEISKRIGRDIKKITVKVDIREVVE